MSSHFICSSYDINLCFFFLQDYTKLAWKQSEGNWCKVRYLLINGVFNFSFSFFVSSFLLETQDWPVPTV